MVSFKVNHLNLDGYLRANALNAKLYAWMLSVNPEDMTDNCPYAFHTKRSDWDGKPYSFMNFSDAYFFLKYAENGKEITMQSEQVLVYDKNTFLNINTPFYFTWAVVFAYLCLDTRFKLSTSLLKEQLAKKLEDVHKPAYDSLLQLISEEQSIRSNIAGRGKAKIVESETNRLDVAHQQEVELLKAEIEKLKSENEAMRAKPQESIDDEEENLESSFTATPQQTILLFKAFGIDFTNGSYNKKKVAEMLSILIGKHPQNIRTKLTQLGKNAAKDQQIIDDLLKEIKA